jgi:hypothetical protein
LWDASALQLVHETEPVPDLFGEVAYVSELNFSRAGDRLALTTGTGVYVQVFDVEKRTVLWTSDHLGGRMGEPARPVWSSDGRHLWAAYVGGAMPIEQVDLEEPIRHTTLVRGRPPEVGGELAVFTAFQGVCALDARRGSARWIRVTLGREGSMFQTVDGWFDASFDDLAGLNAYRHSDQETGTPLVELATRFFDPKRVRAMRAGVALAAASW